MDASILSVSTLTRSIQQTLESNFRQLTVSGELSNFKQHGSGHRYFTLKDAKAQISCTMWRSRSLRFAPANGMQVLVTGNVTVYPPRGNYQLDCVSMRPMGLGDLQIAFEALKRALYEEGLFDADHKISLPRFPQRVGVITSATGAAIRDISTTLARRMPSVEMVVHPAAVQGAEAAPDLVRALKRLDGEGVDTIIIGRGGGSIEDLWAFNTEEVARAIFACRTPIIAAIGHEVDITIADYVADARAATPTAAAELAVRDRAELIGGLDAVHERLDRLIDAAVAQRERQLEQLIRATAWRRPAGLVRTSMQLLDEHQQRMSDYIERAVRRRHEKLTAMARHCEARNPLTPLDRGFALLRQKDHIVGPQTEIELGEVEIWRRTQRLRALVSQTEHLADFTEELRQSTE